MNVLVLHGLGSNLASARGTSVSHLRCFETYAPQHRYFLHDLHAPVSNALKSFSFDLILIDGTFLCWRWVRPRSLLTELKSNYEWVSASHAVKIAFPQDDYDHSLVLDQWLNEWNVDFVYTICKQHHEILYPSFRNRPDAVGVALTGYVDDERAEQVMLKPTKAIGERTIDVGYRARSLPAYYGAHGQLKSTLGDRFQSACGQVKALVLDISTDESKVLIGQAWHDFLENSKYTLGCLSGSSILDETGEVRDAVDTYLQQHVNADFDDVAAAVLHEVDCKYVFDMVSPRMFEAATLGSCQILVEGCYLPEMRPGTHYVELKHDLSNIEEVIALVTDEKIAQLCASNFFDNVIRPSKYKYSTRVAEVFEKALSIKALKNVTAGGATSRDFEDMVLSQKLFAEFTDQLDQVAKEMKVRVEALTVQVSYLTAAAQSGTLARSKLSRLLQLFR